MSLVDALHKWSSRALASAWAGRGDATVSFQMSLMVWLRLGRKRFELVGRQKCITTLAFCVVTSQHVGKLHFTKRGTGLRVVLLCRITIHGRQGMRSQIASFLWGKGYIPAAPSDCITCFFIAQTDAPGSSSL